MPPKSSQSPSRSKSPARATPKKKPAAATLLEIAGDFTRTRPLARARSTPHRRRPLRFVFPPPRPAGIGYGTVYLCRLPQLLPDGVRRDAVVVLFVCILWLIVLLYPSRFTVVASMLVRVAQYWAQAPMTWESCYWANATELAFVAILLLCPLDTVVHQSQDLIRLMMGWFYVGAGFWKINTSFLDTSVSCGPVYVVPTATFVPEPALHGSLRTPSRAPRG